MVTGTALRWNSEKRFGFVKPDDGTEDLFCHHSDIEDGDSLADNSRVAFMKVFDAARGKVRAERVTGGIGQAPSPAAAPPPAPAAGGAFGGQSAAEIAANFLSARSQEIKAPPPPGKVGGTVKRWNEEKGFGFIVPDAGGDDCFCHIKSIMDGDSLAEGSRVFFVQV